MSGRQEGFCKRVLGVGAEGLRAGAVNIAVFEAQPGDKAKAFAG